MLQAFRLGLHMPFFQGSIPLNELQALRWLREDVALRPVKLTGHKIGQSQDEPISACSSQSASCGQCQALWGTPSPSQWLLAWRSPSPALQLTLGHPSGNAPLKESGSRSDKLGSRSPSNTFTAPEIYQNLRRSLAHLSGCGHPRGLVREFTAPLCIVFSAEGAWAKKAWGS